MLFDWLINERNVVVNGLLNFDLINWSWPNLALAILFKFDEYKSKPLINGSDDLSVVKIDASVALLNAWYIVFGGLNSPLFGFTSAAWASAVVVALATLETLVVTLFLLSLHTKWTKVLGALMCGMPNKVTGQLCRTSM
jgi:hypothetical protein